MPTIYYDRQGELVHLGDKLGEGGEGAVYAIAGKPGLVAKVYKGAIDKEKEKKLQLMSAIKADAIAAFAAWPITTLSTYCQGPVQGIVIPRIDGASEIHEVYNPSHRKQNFPTFDYRHLVRTARNTAIAVSKLHEKNIVIGDVNQGNFFVDKLALVKLIDCDSFQITTSSGVFKCYVGVPHFTPPGLQAARLSECVRTQNHDNFGLAVMIFHLLFMGRHPFVGFTGKGDMPIERAIREHRFAFGSNAPRFEMSPPPNSLTAGHFPIGLFNLFERAFAPPVNGSIKRPTACEWEAAIASMEAAMRKCEDEDGHFYWHHLRTCPWCDINNRGGPNFFVSTVTTPVAQAFTLIDIQKQIASIPTPERAFQMVTTTTATPSIAPVKHTFESSKDDIRLIFGIISIVFCGVALVMAFFSLFAASLFLVSFASGIVSIVSGSFWYRLWKKTPYFAIRERLLKSLTQAESELSAATLEMRRLARLHKNQFDEKLASFATLQRSLQNLPSEQSHELSNLHRNVRLGQLESYLRRQFIDQAAISGIGPARIAALESFGIDSAWYVTRRSVEVVPGFGPELTSRVVAWRASLESKFRFGPSSGVPQNAVQLLAQKYEKQRRQLENAIRRIPNELLQINQTYIPQVSMQWRVTEQAEWAFSKAKAEMNALPSFTL